eukprot:4381585-Pleurochrysis_carterae.AAC.1
MPPRLTALLGGSSHVLGVRDSVSVHASLAMRSRPLCDAQQASVRCAAGLACVCGGCVRVRARAALR